MKIFDNYLTALKYFVLAGILLATVHIQAQENKTRIKIKKIEDGKTVVVDTVLVNPSQEEIDGIMGEYKISSDHDGVINIDVEGVKGNERIIIKDGGSGDHESIWIDHEGGVHEKGNNVWFFQSDEPKTYLGIMMRESIAIEKIESINGEDVRTVETDGVVVDEVIDDSPAAKAGFLANDVIKGMDGKDISNSKELLDFLSEKNPGDVVQVQIERAGQIQNLSVALGERDQMPEIKKHFEFKEGHGPQHMKERIHKRMAGHHAFLGINLGHTVELINENGKEQVIRSNEEDVNGVLVSGLVSDGPAEKAGLLANDVIVAMDGQTITSHDDLHAFLKEKKPNDVVKITVERGSKKKKFNVTLGEHNDFPRHFSKHFNIEIDGFDDDHEKMMNIWHDKDGSIHQFKDGDFMFFSDDYGSMVHEYEIETEKDGQTIRKQVIVRVMVRDLSETDKDQLEDDSFKIDNSLKLDKLSFYPNPNNGSFNLSFETPEQGDVTIMVTDISGKEMFNRTLENFTGTFNEVINIPNAADGLYIVQIQQNGKVVNKKVAIQ